MILVTGGAGYLGCILVRSLIERGRSVRIFDRMLFGEEPLSAFRDRIDLVEGDIRSIQADVLAGIDTVIHLAGLSNDPMAEYNPRANYEINTIATERLAKMSKEAGVRRFSFASTCSIYDRGFLADDLLLDETAEVSPRAAYAVSNYDAERVLLQLADSSFCPVILRQGTIFGYSPRMRYDLVVNTFVRDAMSCGHLTVFGGGAMWRPLVDVRDVAEAHVAAVDTAEEAVNGEIFNISHRNCRILDLAYEVKEALSDILEVAIEVNDLPFEGRSYRVSSAKMERRLGFCAKRSVRDTVLDMVGCIQAYDKTDFSNPLYYNIKWMTDRIDGVFAPSQVSLGI
jgi:nucleoside-diphosphate-sugar epimerase